MAYQRPACTFSPALQDGMVSNGAVQAVVRSGGLKWTAEEFKENAVSLFEI